LSEQSAEIATKHTKTQFNWAWQLVILIAVAGLAVWLAYGNPGKQGAPAGGDSSNVSNYKPVVHPPAPPQPLLENDEPYHGIAWQIHRSEDCVPKAERMLTQIANLGADTVLISNAGYQEHAGSATFEIDPAVTPSTAQWREIFSIAHSKGLRVILMPIVLLSEPRGTEWRGVISPPDWDIWFNQYREFLLHFARLAEENELEVLMVGSELVSTERFTDRWEAVIREVRSVYGGKLTYSSNWDHYKVIQFWDKLDLVGMTSYYKLASEPGPSLQDLKDEWKPIKAGLLRWQKKVGKPLLFTEVGWCSQEGASIEPWNYYRHQKPTPEGLEEQRRCYRAFMDTWEDCPAVGGVIWWEWTDTAGGPKDFNYTPKGKPAEAELREWFAEIRQQRVERTETQPSESPETTPAN
jgi:hypothetical protein